MQPLLRGTISSVEGFRVVLDVSLAEGADFADIATVCAFVFAAPFAWDASFSDSSSVVGFASSEPSFFVAEDEKSVNNCVRKSNHTVSSRRNCKQSAFVVVCPTPANCQQFARSLRPGHNVGINWKCFPNGL